MVNSQGEVVKFRRHLTAIENQEWLTALVILSQISYIHNLDVLSWRWETSGKFTIKSLYRVLNFKGKLPPQPILWWNVPIPLKIRIFMWLTSKKKILTRDKLVNTKCQFYTLTETVDHLFVQCSFAKQVWFWMEACQALSPSWSSLKEIIQFAC